MCFILLCSPVNLSKDYIYAFIGRLKQVFSCFYHSIFDALINALFILWNSPSMHSVNKCNTAFFNRSCNVFTCLFYRKWNKALTGGPAMELWPACSIRKIFVCICMCSQSIIIILIFSLSTDL